MKRTLALSALVLLLSLGINAQTITAAPATMNFQGHLAKQDGTPIADGIHTVTFRIYDASTGGNVKWAEQLGSLITRNGVFSAVLGKVFPFNDIVLNGGTWLEIQVESDAPLIPRQQFQSVAYALKANTVPDGAITTAKIADGAITAAKLAPQAMQANIPSGIVMAYAGSVIPEGYLLCDGSAVGRTAYPELFAAIGVAHGVGDTISTFNLPDYRGLFLRMVDGNAGRDPDAANRSMMALGGNTGNSIGSIELDIFASHAHDVSDPGHSHSWSVANYNTGDSVGGANTGPSVDARLYKGNNTWVSGVSVTGISILANGGNETRPKNAYVYYIIKY